MFMSTLLTISAKLKRECEKIWTKYTQRKTTENELLNTKPNHVMIIVLDGVSKRVFEEAETPAIRDLIKEGIYAHNCFTVFPTVTPTAHVSLNTGAYPETTSYIAWNFREHLFRANTANRAETLAEVANNMGYLSTAICEAAARGANIVISEAVCGFDMDKTTEFVVRIFKEHKPNLLNITYYCTDDLSEKFGPQSHEALSTLQYVDSCIETIRECLKDSGILEESLFIITADHGITSVSKVFSKGTISKTVNELPVKLAFYDRTIHFYYENEEKIENELVKRLSTIDGVKYLFTKPELVLLGCNAPQIGSAVLTMDEGYCYCQRLIEKGTHGGYSEVEVNVPLILSGCGIDKNSNIKFARIIDIAPTVAYLLGVPQPRNADGRILIEALDGRFELKNIDLINEVREKMHNYIEEINRIKYSFAVDEITIKEYENEKFRMLNEAYMLRNREKILTEEVVKSLMP